MPKVITCIVGPRAVGKTTLANYMSETYKFKRITTTTDRPKRDSDKDSDYFFVDKATFAMLRDEGNAFIETNNYFNNNYGLSKASVELALSENDFCSIVMDPNGAIALSAYAQTNEAYESLGFKFNVFVVFLRAPQSIILSRFLARKGSLNSEDLNLLNRDCTLFLDQLQEGRMYGAVEDLLILDATQPPEYLAKQLMRLTSVHFESE